MHTSADMVGKLGLAMVAILSVAAFGCAASGDETDGRADDQTETPPRADVDPATPDTTTADTPEKVETPAATTPATTPPPPASTPELPGKVGDPTSPITPPDASTCRAPHDMGSLSGDLNQGTLTAQGTCSEWLRVRLTEDAHSVFAGQMKVTATLVSPAGENFDIYLHVNAATDVLECTTVAAKSELGAGQSDVAKTAWGESYSANSVDDSRYVSIEIKKHDGTCAKSPWSLVVQGNY